MIRPPPRSPLFPYPTLSRSDPDQARADQAAGDDHRDHEPIEDDVQPVQQVVEPLVNETDLDLTVPELLEHVVDLVRKLERDRKSTRLNSSHLVISYAVFCLK